MVPIKTGYRTGPESFLDCALERRKWAVTEASRGLPNQFLLLLMRRKALSSGLLGWPVFNSHQHTSLGPWL